MRIIPRIIATLLLIAGLIVPAQAGSTTIEGGYADNWTAPSLGFRVDSRGVLWVRGTQDIYHGVYLTAYGRKGSDEGDFGIGWNGTHAGFIFNCSLEYWSFSALRRSIEDLAMTGCQIGKEFATGFGTFTPYARLELWKPMWSAAKFLPQVGVRHSLALPGVTAALQSAFGWTGVHVPPMRLDSGLRFLYDPGVIVQPAATNYSIDGAAVWLPYPNVEIALPKIRYINLVTRPPQGDIRGPNTTLMVEFKIVY
ncbi:MAG: hypothetical protein AAB803_00435 [Patescibacteria group bacterium]